jgi:hypothetical protein
LVGVLSLVVLRLLDALHLVVDTSMGGVAVLSFRGTMDHTSLFVVLYSSRSWEWFPRGGHIALIEWFLLTPLLSKWLGTGLTLFVLTPVLSRLLPLALGYDFARERLGGLLVDQLRGMATGN